MTVFQNLNHRLEVKSFKQRPWSNEIHKAVKECRLTWWKWRKSGASKKKKKKKKKKKEHTYLRNMVSAK